MIKYFGIWLFQLLILTNVFLKNNIPISLVWYFNRKLKKTSNELEDKMDALSLDELSLTSTKQRLSQLENLFSFPTTESSTFPQNHCQEFIQQVQNLPQGKILLLCCVWFVWDVVCTGEYIMGVKSDKVKF